MTTAGLIVFSQVLGVIITPRILDSSEVTLAVLIDDLLKRTMNTSAAMRVGLAEVILALPVAAVAAYFVEGELRARGRPLMTALRFRGGRILALIPIVILLLVPTVLLALSLGPTPILDPTAVFRSGPTVHWYRLALGSAAFWSVSASSIYVWTTATLLSVFPATFLSVLLLPFSQLRRIGRWIALLLLFIPQNALGVLLFVATSSVPQAQASFPGWLFGGIGQAVPGFAFCFLLMDRVAEQQARSLRIAATLGASFIQRFMRIALPRFLPAIGFSIAATALISLDDIIFVRYLPRVPVATFATQLFDQARYGASPDLAAFCILIAAVVGLLLSGGMLLESIPRVRRALVRRFLGRSNVVVSQLTH
jgi:ABC-type spermidine/putrescine transport system permease subunit II